MSTLNPNGLEGRILEAHAEYDPYALAELYERAAKHKRAEGDKGAAGFLLTQAYVFALESAHPSAENLRNALVFEGREQAE